MSMELDMIYNEDCLKGMQRIPDKTIDLIVCDLPYGLTPNSWDVRIPLDRLWGQYHRIMKDNTAVILFGKGKFVIELANANLKEFRYAMTWDKKNPVGFLNANRMPLRRTEDILVFYKRLPKYNPQYNYAKPYKMERINMQSQNYQYYKDSSTYCNDGRRYPTDLISISNADHRGYIHPTQKPVPLLEYLIRTYSDEGDGVLDNCMGSGTTAVACINTNRHFIGFETDKGYYLKSLERIKKTIK